MFGALNDVIAVSDVMTNDVFSRAVVAIPHLLTISIRSRRWVPVSVPRQTPLRTDSHHKYRMVHGGHAEIQMLFNKTDQLRADIFQSINRQ